MPPFKSATNLQPEVDVLVQTLMIGTSPKQISELLENPIDWGYFIELVRRHRILLPTFHAFKQYFPTAMPTAIFDEMQRHALQHIFHNMLLKGELIKILRLFADANIKAMPLKGPVLAEQLHGNITTREFSDLDLLIPKEDVIRAQELLIAAGYNLLTYNVKYAFKGEYNFTFENSQNGVHLELHWNLARLQYPTYREADYLWASSQMTAYESTPIWVPRAEDMILFLSVHAFRHYWWRLLWLYDIMKLIQIHPTLDYDYLYWRAEDLHSQKILSMNLLFLDNLFQLKTPTLGEYRANGSSGLAPNPPLLKPVVDDEREQNHHLHPKVSERIAQRVEQDFALNQFKKHTTLKDFWLVALPLVGSWSDQLRYFRLSIVRWLRNRFVPTKVDHDWVKLPKQLHFLYYVTRLIRVTIRYTRLLLKKLERKQ